MQVHLVQADTLWEQPAANLDALGRRLETLSPRPGDLVVLPEMFATGFSMAAPATAERRADGPSSRFLSRWARSAGCCLVGGVATRDDDGRFFNEALAALPSGEIARYQKHQPFTPAGEREIFAAGDRLLSFTWSGWRIGLTICYDLRFPEIYRALARDGADLLVNIANWPARRREHWSTLLRARAIENQAYVVGVNRVGRDPNLDYAGDSLVADPRGEIVLDAGASETVATATLDAAAVASWRSEFPALADAREPAPAIARH